METKQDFTISLALVDLLPVLFFGAAMAVLGLRLGSFLFTAGAVICVLAGLGKVIWKIMIAVWGKDIRLLGAQLRFVMPVGFLLMIAGAFSADRRTAAELFHKAVRMPSVMFFVLAACGIAGMILCAKKFDRYDVRGNWIEQVLNSAAQGCVLAGILLL